jgi:hypothetical protein
MGKTISFEDKGASTTHPPCYPSLVLVQRIRIYFSWANSPEDFV